jgi:hypothetical protein
MTALPRGDYCSALWLRNFIIEADFLVPLQLHYPAVVDHQLDRAIADCAEGLAELPEERRRQLERIVWAGLGARREGNVRSHDPI